MKNINILLYVICLLISINEIASSEVKIIPDANLNATAAYVLIDSLESKTNFLYFSFDFDYHNKIEQKIKNEAYFKVTTDSKHWIIALI